MATPLTRWNELACPAGRFRGRRFLERRARAWCVDLDPATPDLRWRRRRSCPTGHRLSGECLFGDTARCMRSNAAFDASGSPRASSRPRVRPPAVRRETAIAMPSSGAPEDTGQSDPSASGAPESHQAVHPVLPVGRSWPSRGTVSTVISASSCAHSGCMHGMTPSCANRSRSASSTSCTCAITGRRSRGPLVSIAYSMASSACRTAASPMAWMWICKPSSSTRRAASARLSPSHTCMPWSCRPEQYGASSAPVSFSTTPSAKNLTVLRGQQRRARRSLTRRRASANVRHLRVEVARIGVEGEVEPDAAGRRVGRPRGRCRRRPARPRRPAPR